MTNDELIQQLKDPKKSHKAFEAMVRQYSEQMYWKIRHIVNRHEDADDILQNSFIKAWTKIDTFRADSMLSTWLYRICINESLDFLRKKREQLSPDGSMAIAETIVADQYFDADETHRLLQKAIQSLPDAQRATFTLRYFDEMPYKEMSEILGTSEAGLKTNYHLAVKKIKQFFDDND